MSSESFVTVRHAFVEYPEVRSAVDVLTGRRKIQHSALRDISFSLGMGDAATVFGVSGAGKSTLLRMLAGVISPSQGTVLVNGKAPASNRDIAAGYVSGEESEPLKDTVSEVLHEYGRTHRIENLPARIGAASEILGMDDFLSRSA
ncbi:MAG: ATP-binding cassette domain-containing protein, partial [Candidatus Binatia bacterium]